MPLGSRQRKAFFAALTKQQGPRKPSQKRPQILSPTDTSPDPTRKVLPIRVLAPVQLKQQRVLAPVQLQQKLVLKAL